MPLEAIIAILVGAGLIVLSLIIVKYRRGSVRNDVKELEVRFNALKTIPLTFKLNKATYIAKINDELAQSVEAYHPKIEKAQKDIDELQELMNALEDDLANKKFKKCKEAIVAIDSRMKETEEEVARAEEFLDSITQKEQIQREHANALKDRYRDLKALVTERAGDLMIAYEGVELKLKECEDLFSSFEEQIYGNEFVQASEALDSIEGNMTTIRSAIDEIPSLVELAKGTIPTLIEEVTDYYLKTRAKGVCTNNISVELKLKEIGEGVNKCSKAIVDCEVEGVADKLADYRQQLEDVLEGLSREDLAFEDLKHVSVKIDQDLRDIEKTYYYISKVYDTDRNKYDLGDLAEVIDKTPAILEDYRNEFTGIGEAVQTCMTPSSTVLERAQRLDEKVDATLKGLLEHKQSIDKTSNDEARANTQIIKLQIVLNEIDVKIAQYRLPTISDAYKSDMKKGYDYIAELKGLLEEIPLDITRLNQKLDEAIDYIYKLYNDVNNVVGMAVMIEIAIVFGNKYRSSYNYIDADLSRAELCYMNGEYTQALTIALACIDKLMPKNGDAKILEYAKGME